MIFVSDTPYFQSELPCLAELNMVNNPIEERTQADGTWRPEIEKKLIKLKKLDGKCKG